MFNKIKQLNRELGVVNSLFYLVNRFFDKSGHPTRIVKYYLVAQKLPKISILPTNRGRDIKIIELLPDTLNHPFPRPRNVIKDRYYQGAVCLAAYKSNTFIGCLWYVKHQYIEDEVRCIFKLASPQSVWDFDVYVEPKHRLSPVFLKLWDEAAKQLRKQGYEWSISRISAFNSTSIFSHRRMGAKTIGSTTFICIGNYQFTIANIFPFIHFSKNKKSIPNFILIPPE